MREEKKPQRVRYADEARVCAAAFVVLLHTAGLRLLSAEIGSAEFIWSVFFDAVSRWSVPLFIMLSGMLFLRKDRTLDIKKLYLKNTLRLVTAFIFWSYIYNVYSEFALNRDIFGALLGAFRKIPDGAMHLWFIYVMVGLYTVLPFVKKMTDNMSKKEAEAFLIINIMVTFLPKTLSCFKAFAPILAYIGNFEICYAAGYVGLFVAGWYIESFEHGKYFTLLSCISGICGFLFMFFGTIFASSAKGELAEEFMSFKSLGAYAMAFAVFALFKRFSGRKGGIIAFERFGGYMFGVYLVHELFVSVLPLDKLPAGNMTFVAIISAAAGVFIVSLIISWGISKLPFGKYIV